MKTQELKALVKELNEASKAYYETGRTIMDDAEFDIKLEQLKNSKKKPELFLVIVQHTM